MARFLSVRNLKNDKQGHIQLSDSFYSIFNSAHHATNEHAFMFFKRYLTVMFSLSASFHLNQSLNRIGRRQLTRFSFYLQMSTFPPLSSQADDIYVVSTASRGIGLEFTRQLLSRTEGRVFAFHRSVSPPSSLLQLQQTYGSKLLFARVDLQDQETIDKTLNTFQSLGIDSITMLFNVSGILGDGLKDPGPERSLEKINREWINSSFETNLIGHVMVTKALAPLLQKSIQKNPTALTKIVNLSARVGSISDNQLGGWYSYRMSKAALNMFTKTLSVEMKRYRVTVISIHPGTTDTDLSKPFQKNVKPEKLFTLEYSVRNMLNVIWKTRLEDTGKFFAYDGLEIPF